jgi:hypothetical protein
MQWALDMTLIVLLALTLFHALRLERALGVLKRDRNALEELVAGFNASTRLAEQGIERLREAADGAGRHVARQVEAGGALRDDLGYLMQRGEKLADRLDTLVGTARLLPPEALRALSSPTAIPVASQATVPSGEGAPPPVVANGEPRLRSQAERDLMRALQRAR